MTTAEPEVTFDMIEEAEARISDVVRTTPCPRSSIGERFGTDLFLKLENLQRTGSFKERGALNKLLALSNEERARGVVAASAGNHAQGVAYNSKRLGVDATICMPVTTPLIKVQRTRALGARVVLHGDGYDQARDRAHQIREDEGLTYVSPFDDPWVIAGQGTIALEILKANPFIDVYIVPIGGGGLIAGVALAAKETNPRIKIIGVESEAMDAMLQSVNAGHVVEIERKPTIADGISVSRVSDLTFDIVQRYVDDIVTVSEESIASAILMLLEEEKTVAEAAAAVTIAALMEDKVPQARGKKSCAMISGGNIDVNMISRIIDRGLEKDGRLMRVTVGIPDRPGALARLTTLIGELQANILESTHQRRFSNTPLGETIVQLVLETRGTDHVAEIEQRLQNESYRLD